MSELFKQLRLILPLYLWGRAELRVVVFRAAASLCIGSVGGVRGTNNPIYAFARSTEFAQPIIDSTIITRWKQCLYMLFGHDESRSSDNKSLKLWN